jgi:hypothetical protein
VNTITEIPPVTDWREHRKCDHGVDDLAGYVVTYTFFDAASGVTTFQDVEYVDDPHQYGRAVESVHEARARIARGEVCATYAAIHCVYTYGHRMA